MQRLLLRVDVIRRAPTPLPPPEPVHRAGGGPLRIRVRGSRRHGFIEWEVLEALVEVARQSDLDVEVECISADGVNVLMAIL